MSGSIVDLIEGRVREVPRADAVRFGERAIDYRELWSRSAGVARALRRAGVERGGHVAVLLERTPEAVAALVGIWQAGGVYVPLDPSHPARRIAMLVEDSRAELVLAEGAAADGLPSGVRVLRLDERPEADGADGADGRGDGARAFVDLAPGEAAYVIFTSGSTGRPKPVVVEHRGLPNLAETMRRAFDLGPGDRMLRFASPAFDASILETLAALGSGAALQLGSPEELSPGRPLASLLRRREVTHAMLLPSVLAVTPAGDLPRLRVVISGGEACPGEVRARWAPGRRFFNAYGPTEATVFSTLHEHAGEEGAPPIGREIPGHTVHLLDARGRPVPDGEPGEIHLGGVGVARGYLGLPELTAERFVPDPFCAEPGARLYRTGDRARRLPDGNLEYLGRTDEQLKIRGVRIEPGEIESTLASHPSVREAVVAGRSGAGGLRLCAWVVLEDGPRPEAGPEPETGRPGRVGLPARLARELREFLAERLPSHLVPSAFYAIEAVPRTPGGKLDRVALPAPEASRPPLGTEWVAPREGLEAALTAIFERELGIAPVGAHDDFFALGGDSLAAVRVMARIAEERPESEPFSTALFEAPTVAALARRLVLARPSVSSRSDAPPGEPEEPGERGRSDRTGRLSFAQERAWFLEQAEPGTAALHLAAVLRISGSLDVEVLGRALSALCERQEALRLRVVDREGRPSAVLAPPERFDLETIDLRQSDRKAIGQRVIGAEAIGGETIGPVPAGALDALVAEEAARRFDLARGPLLRARLARLGEGEHALVLVLHHLVGDAWSLGAVQEELAVLYGDLAAGRALSLPPLPLRHAEHAARQRRALSGGRLERELAFWRRELTGAPPLLRLPLDRERPATPSHRGGLVRFEVAPALLEPLEEVGRAEGATPFMALLAAWLLLLRGFGTDDDLVIATPVAGRGGVDDASVVGCFADVVAVRASLAGGPSFRELLGRVRRSVAGALAHQALPFGALVEALRPPRTPGVQPIAQAMFALQPPPRPASVGGGARFRLEEVDTDAASFDLLLRLRPDPDGRGGLGGVVVHRAELFDLKTIRAMVAAYLRLLACAARAPDERLPDLAERAGLDAGGWREAEQAACGLERELLSDPAVEDCAVRSRRTLDGAVERLAWLVAREPVAKVRERIEGRLDPRARPDAWVPLDALPLATDGTIDELALARVPVLDEGLLVRCEQALRTEDREVGAVVERARRPLPMLSLPRSSTGAPSPNPPPHDAFDRGGRAEPSADAADAADPGVPPALADGGTLVLPGGEPRTLGEALRRAAETAEGVVWAEPSGAVTQPYAQLFDLSRALLSGLRDAGLGPGDRLLLLLERPRDQLEAFWAAVLGGMLPIVAPASQLFVRGGAERLDAIHFRLGRPPILASAAVAEHPVALDGRPLAGARVLRLEALSGGPPAPLHAARPDEDACLQLSSGSTALPKCVRLTHRAIALHHFAVARMNGYRRSDVTLNWLPFDHVGALVGWHLKDVWIGNRQVQADTARVLADPLLWLDLASAHRATHSWAPNFAFKSVVDRLPAPGRSWDLSSLASVLSGGEQVSLEVARAFVRLLAPFGLPRHAVQPSFGMAESCTGVTYHERFDPEVGFHRVARSSLAGRLVEAAPDDRTASVFVDLGRPIPGVRLRVVGDDGRLVGERRVGRLQLAGEVITPGYLDDEADRAAFTADGWFDTGDLGFLAGGRLTLTGREKDVVIVRGVNVACTEVEAAVAGLAGIAPGGVAACAVDDARAGGEGIAVFFVPAGSGEASPGAEPAVAGDEGPLARTAAAISRRVASEVGAAPAFVVPISDEELPRTTSGKIRRAELRRALADGRFDRALAALARPARLAGSEGAAESASSAGIVGEEARRDGEVELPAWFHRRGLRRREVGIAGAPGEGTTLLLLDEAGLGEALLGGLRAGGGRCVLVERGGEFARLGPDRFRVAPGDRRGFRALLADCAEGGGPVERIVHLWTWGEPGAPGAEPHVTLSGDAFGLLPLLGALATGAVGRRVRLVVGASHCQPGGEVANERIVPERAALLGLLAALPHELRHVDARHVDLPPGDPAVAAKLLLPEIAAARAEREVVHARGARYVVALEPAALGAAEPVGGEPNGGARASTNETAFRPGGAWLITGGLGALGLPLARHLLERHRARLLLVGRTALDGAGEVAATRSEALRRLAETADRVGGEVLYGAVDVGDPAALERAAAEVEARWGRPLDGALHLAGLYARRPFAEETEASFAATLRPKVEGIRALGALLDARPGSVLVGYSSLAATLGGWASGAYAAANRYVEHFLEARRAAGSPSRCLAWGPWDEPGSDPDGQVDPPLGRTRGEGLLLIGPGRGVVSLVAGLSAPPAMGPLLVGLDARSALVRRRSLDATPTLERIAVRVGGARPARTPEVRDRFGVPVPIEIVEIADPTASDPAGGEEAARAPGPTALPKADGAARNEAERAIAAVWREVLGLESVGVHDNFFDLGGQSVLLAEVRARLSRMHGREIPILDLFRAPTIAGLAARLAGLVEARAVEREVKPDDLRSRAGARAARQLAALDQPPSFVGRRRRGDG